MNPKKDDKNSQGPTNEELSDAALDKVVGGMASPEPTSLRRKSKGGDNDDLSAGTPGQVLFNDISDARRRGKGDNDDASGGTPGQIGFGDMA